MRTATPVAQAASQAWHGLSPTASVVVATYQRRPFLAELVSALEAQHPPTGGFEVIVVDDGSTDGTWEELERLIARTALPMLALRLQPNGGPSVPRNTGAAHCRGELLAFTDDDCLPDQDWLRALCGQFVEGVTVVQGLTRPGPGSAQGAWDRSINVTGITGLYETCNLAVRTAVFTRVGGFTLLPTSTRAPRGFGEDVLLGVAAAREGAAAWAPEALVQHRWLSGTFRDHLASRRRLVDFPLLVKEVPELRDRLYGRIFLSRSSASINAALVGLAVAPRRRPAVLAVLPWFVLVHREARQRPGRPLPWRVAQIALSDLVAWLSLVQGSVRHRSWLV